MAVARNSIKYISGLQVLSQVLQTRHHYPPGIQSPTAFLVGKWQPGGNFPGRSQPFSVAQHSHQEWSNDAELLQHSGIRNPGSQTLFLEELNPHLHFPVQCSVRLTFSLVPDSFFLHSNTASTGGEEKAVVKKIPLPTPVTHSQPYDSCSPCSNLSQWRYMVQNSKLWQCQLHCSNFLCRFTLW